MKCGCPIYFFLNSANLTCRGKDISKYFREYLGLRNNESRLQFRFPFIKDDSSTVININIPIIHRVPLQPVLEDVHSHAN